MAKQKKKRSKVYTGADAKIIRPSITRMTATNRSGPQQWYFERKKIIRPISITIVIAIVVVWLLIELIRIISGGVA